MGYSLERKSAVLKRMLPPNNVAIRQLSKEEGIGESTLFSWRAEARSKGQLLPDADASPAGHHRATLANRASLYASARSQNPERWSGQTRNWQPAGPVWLNPETEISPSEIRDAA